MTVDEFVELVLRVLGANRRPNPEQRACLAHDPAIPLLIVAEPGSGKSMRPSKGAFVLVAGRQPATSLKASPSKVHSVPTSARRLFEHRVEHRPEVAGRAVDDLQDLGGRGLLLQRLVALGTVFVTLNGALVELPL